MGECFTLKPVGYISSPYKSPGDVPRGDMLDATIEARINLLDEYVPAAKDMKKGEKYLLVFYMHLITEEKLEARPMGIKPPVGIFSTLNPSRPNKLGISLITVKDICGGVISFCGVDMIEGTPIIDIKPYRFD